MQVSSLLFISGYNTISVDLSILDIFLKKMQMSSSDNSDFSQTIFILKMEQTFYKGVVNFHTFLYKHWNRCNRTESKKESHYTGRIQIDMRTKCPASVANFMTIKVAYTLLTCCEIKTWSKHTVRLHWTLAVLFNFLTQLNCGQLQCIMVVNRQIAVHSECQFTIHISRENKYANYN